MVVVDRVNIENDFRLFGPTPTGIGPPVQRPVSSVQAPILRSRRKSGIGINEPSVFVSLFDPEILDYK